MKILVTGGAGYIGTELIRKLLLKDEVSHVVVYDNLSRPNFNLFLGNKTSRYSKLEFVKGDILDSRGLGKAMQGVDVVYHLAAKVTTPFAHADQHGYEQINHWGTAEVAYAAEVNSIGKLIYLSSTGVYGSVDSSVDESSPVHPQTFYAQSKWRGEEQIRRLKDKMETYIFRCANVYGYSKSMRFDAVINKFVFDANFNKRITIQGDGHQSRPFIQVDQLSLMLSNLITSSLPRGTYNLVEHNRKVIDIVDQLKELLPDLEFLFMDHHVKMNNLVVLPNTNINRSLGVEPSTTFKDELKDFLNQFAF